MAKTKKPGKNSGKPSVKVRDLKPEKNPQGGAIYMKKPDAMIKQNLANKLGAPTAVESANYLKIK